jgi:uncharacterized protein
VSLRDRLTEEMKLAMKAKDELRLATIRQVRSVMKNREIDQKQELDDQGISEVVSSLAKQRRESIKMFRDAGREELATKEETELNILLEFLPQQLSREEVVALVSKSIADSGAQGAKDMGKVMKVLMPQVSGRADGKLVNDVVKELLANL